MATLASAAGKTAPRIVHDCTRLDINHIINQYNVLTQFPPRPRSSIQAKEPISQDACRHEFTTVHEASTLPPFDHRATHGDRWSLEIICTRCRSRLNFHLANDGCSSRLCPNASYPLHHFVYSKPDTWLPADFDFVFTCSSPDCGSILRISCHHPSIIDSDIRLLTDTENLRRRFRQATQDEPDRGFRHTTPVETLARLRRYIGDAIKSQGPDKKIPAKNKRFLEAFGVDCNVIFEQLGFHLQRDDEAGVEMWFLPRCNDDSYVHAGRIAAQWRSILARWDVELHILGQQFKHRQDSPPIESSEQLPSAHADMMRLLSAQGYQRCSRGRSEQIQTPACVSLGALDDYSDELIQFCYERQTMCDPQSGPYYYDCLKDLASSRASEQLQLHATVLESADVIGQRDIDEAYCFLDVDKADSDAFIINKYRSRLDDTGPSMRPRMKIMLSRLAHARTSRALTDVVNDNLDSYDQALAWLGAQAEQPDDVMIVLHTTKVADDPSNATLARKAITIIADHRNSEGLRSWLKTGELKENSMSVDEACLHLKIQLDSVDQTMLQVVIDNARSDNPGQKTEQAIAVVTRVYKEPAALARHPPATWPVGLTSHGNTCYLNSLLQYYFTIKPLRELVLDFGNHAFDLAHYHGKQERVGARRVKPYEIRAHQKFVKALAGLFRQMIRDPNSTIKPETDLVCRAFLAPEDTETRVPSAAASDAGLPDVEMTTGALESVQGPPSSSQTSTASSRTLVSPDDALLASSETTVAASPEHSFEAKSDLLQGPPLPARQLTTPELQQSNLEKAEEAARQQQDVTEVMDEIMFRLRCAIKPSGMDSTEEQLDPFRDLFYMQIATASRVNGIDRTPQIEFAMNILLNIPSEPTDLYSALDEVFDMQNIHHGDIKVSQYKTLQTTPPILQINIPRNTYDRSTGRGVKVEHKLHLYDDLFMDRYVDNPDIDLLERRKQCWAWRQQLVSLASERDSYRRTNIGLDGPQTLDAAEVYIAGLDVVNDELAALGYEVIDYDGSIKTELALDAEMLRKRLAQIDQSMTDLQQKIAHTFDGLQKVRYRLQAVFFHRGSYGHGHYWTYIRDFEHDLWRIYNDERVDEFTTLDDIYDAETWQQGTPTYAVYIKDELKEQYVQPVCRDVVIADNTVADVPMSQEHEQDTKRWSDAPLIDLEDGSKSVW